MSRSRRALLRPFGKAATRKAIGPEFWSEAEEALIAADAGVACSTELVERARRRILTERVTDIEGLKEAFRVEVAEMLRSFGAPPELPAERPHVLFVVGVNGVGKTTTCAKIGYRMKSDGLKVIYAAADTFRAAGIEQMEMWAQRVGAPVVRHKTGGDPAAVVFDAMESATAKETDVVIVDTAGRLHTKKNLMDELSKMWRVAQRQLPGEPEALLVIDATTGQNGVAQARIFGEALPLSSIALTKMDGSAKGGVVLAIGRELGIPVSYVGVGEGMTDLRPFDPDEYASALF
ncbi:MAG: signal recognition particle-docking protein FtsY [Actinobacteria bacterium]|nr:signal recognition particle-docking protein FtsY [Actinomycetota bacterium]MBU1942930.1 signal recognition particle-docking protein FtsY [Actinomycetota bacterium]MBU2687310.1 signal recognition particle-docking protein FtsY [Actinomycetota bacterium]